MFGINNRYEVRCGERRYECTLRGKRLDIGVDEYAALAPGDEVSFELISEEHAHGVIERRLERTTSFSRWNNKKAKEQVFAANIDRVVCVAAAKDPAFRERFVDRVLVSAEWHEITPVIVVNKVDLGLYEETVPYLAWLTHLDYQVVLCSAENGTGIDELSDALAGGRSLLIGHSGVGKSSIINRLVPEADLKVSEISRKYRKGIHTTRFGQLIDHPAGGWIVDSPGIRELEVVPQIRGNLAWLYRDFRDLILDCELPGCTHLHEPGCAVAEAVESGRLPEFRYESYGMLHEALEERFSDNYE